MTSRSASSKQRLLYGIHRIDSPRTRTHAWYVRIQRRKRVWKRSFSDKRHGGEPVALRLAIKYRDLILSRYPPLTLAQYVAVKRRNNSSGVAGVCKFIEAKRIGKKSVERLMWLAFWTVNSRRKSAKFSVNLYGEKNAFRLACEARRQGLLQLNGPYVNSKGLRHWMQTHPGVPADIAQPRA
jgi:hypothetical protein